MTEIVPLPEIGVTENENLDLGNKGNREGCQQIPDSSLDFVDPNETSSGAKTDTDPEQHQVL